MYMKIQKCYSLLKKPFEIFHKEQRKEKEESNDKVEKEESNDKVLKSNLTNQTNINIL